jgi:molybdopterin molybdotransferase
MPERADAVVVQEVCERQGDRVRFQGRVDPGSNVRRAGEDIQAGQELLPAGTRLAPQHLGLAASVGLAELPVFRRLRVTIFSTGDELVMPGQALAPGQIYNSNRFVLTGLLQALDCQIVDLGIVRDNFDDTRQALHDASFKSDLILATGGVSVGEEDHVKPAVEALGTLDLWKIGIRPGKPLALGRIGETPFIGTPGNPVSLFVTFCLLARPFILRRQGMTQVMPEPIPVVADFDWPRAATRREYARARLRWDAASGVGRVSIYPSRSSGVLNSVVWANGVAVIPENQTLQKGDRLEFFPMRELMP